jgi:fatty-acid desaturase
MVTKSPMLVEPGFGCADSDGRAYKPTFQEILNEWLYVIDVVANPSHALTVINFIFQLSTSLALFSVCFLYFTTGSFVFLLIMVLVLGTIYNTVWYHRYCSHVAFEFKQPRYRLAFLWTNPLAFIFREEIYAIPHRYHHQHTDTPGDPYGPHLGWLVTFLAPELTQRLNSHISQEEFETLKRSIRHIGLQTHSYDQFRKTGCIESLFHYAARAVFTQFFWGVLVFGFGGASYLASYYCAIFIATVLIRDFNWRGHGGNFPRIKKQGWEFDNRSLALNQHFYGYIASEWHDNHHKYPMSANSGFLPGQIDFAFQIIKLMHRVGIVESYIDARSIFNKECLSFAVKA